MLFSSFLHGLHHVAQKEITIGFCPFCSLDILNFLPFSVLTFMFGSFLVCPKLISVFNINTNNINNTFSSFVLFYKYNLNI